MSQSDAVLIIATPNDQVEDKFQPRANVIHEIGLAQNKLPDKIIYLKEETASFPSNINPTYYYILFTLNQLDQTTFDVIGKGDRFIY